MFQNLIPQGATGTFFYYPITMSARASPRCILGGCILRGVQITCRSAALERLYAWRGDQMAALAD